MPFSQPSRSDVHINAPLSSVSLAFIQSADAFVADRAFPRIAVSKQSDSYFTYDRGYFNRAEMQKRAPGAESAGANYALSSATYAADVWALHRDVADQVRANADSPISLDREATELLTLQGLLRKEKEWASAHFITGVWTTERAGVAAAPTGTQFLRWDVAASTPIEDVRAGVRTVQESTGFRPNRMVLGREVYDALLDHPDIVGRLDRGQTSGTAMVMRDTLAALFEMQEILVMDAIENTANEGATNVHAFIGGKNALLLYAPAAPGLMVPSAGYTFTWNGLLGGGALATRISRMRMDHLKSDRIEIEMAFDQKLVSADLGAMFLDAVS
tara:strand:+ start:26296 stop:27285 length:990 start_codon:yes stop_codon:yes gene_type:complete